MSPWRLFLCLWRVLSQPILQLVGSASPQLWPSTDISTMCIAPSSHPPVSRGRLAGTFVPASSLLIV